MGDSQSRGIELAGARRLSKLFGKQVEQSRPATVDAGKGSLTKCQGGGSAVTKRRPTSTSQLGSGPESVAMPFVTAFSCG
jgi:hypothetical protein